MTPKNKGINAVIEGVSEDKYPQELIAINKTELIKDVV